MYIFGILRVHRVWLCIWFPCDMALPSLLRVRTVGEPYQFHYVEFFHSGMHPETRGDPLNPP